MNITEESFQNTFTSMFNIIYPTAVLSISLSGIDLSSMSPTERGKLVATLKKAGWQKGISDITLFLPEGITLHLEFKRPDGRGVQSQEQKDMEQQLIALNHHYLIIDSFDKAWDAIATHTTPAYRTQCLNSLIDFSKTTLTEPLMMFPAGTPTAIAEQTLRGKYRLN